MQEQSQYMFSQILTLKEMKSELAENNIQLEDIVVRLERQHNIDQENISEILEQNANLRHQVEEHRIFRQKRKKQTEDLKGNKAELSDRNCALEEAVRKMSAKHEDYKKRMQLLLAEAEMKNRHLEEQLQKETHEKIQAHETIRNLQKELTDLFVNKPQPKRSKKW